MPEGGGSVHVCHKCRWEFSNPHPSPKKRAAHKKQCGRINGYPTISSLESDGEGAVGSLGSGSIAKMNLEEELGLGDERNLGNSDVVIKEIFDVASHNSLEEVVNTFDERTEATIPNPVNVANQREEPPIESNHSITEGQLSCEILSVKTDGHSNFSTTQDAKNCSENKKHDEEEEEAQENNKTEEIKSRVVTWQNVKDVIVEESKKPHVALKNLLGETNKEDSSSKHTKRNSLGEMFSPPREKTTHSSSQQPHPEQKRSRHPP